MFSQTSFRIYGANSGSMERIFLRRSDHSISFRRTIHLPHSGRLRRLHRRSHPFLRLCRARLGEERLDLLLHLGSLLPDLLFLRFDDGLAEALCRTIAALLPTSLQSGCFGQLHLQSFRLYHGL